MTANKYKRAMKNARTVEARSKFRRLYVEDKLRSSIVGCQGCGLAETRTNAVPWSGPTTSRLLVVGEAPGANEDEQGVPFVGRAGRLLDEALSRAGFERDDVMVMNTVACRPPQNRNPHQEEVFACEKWRTKQLNQSQAEVVVLAGLAAYTTFTGDFESRMGEVAGKPFWMEGRIWVPAYHPAYILRQPGRKGEFINQVGVAGKILSGEVGWPALPRDAFDFLPSKYAKKIWDKSQPGYALVYSGRLRDLIVVTRDDRVRVPNRIAEQGATYTLEELAKIGQSVGRAGKKLTVGDLKAIHLVKAELGGKVML